MAISHLAFAFGILGNIMSFCVYLSPLPTFVKIFKRKSTEGFQSIPYSVALFSAMLYLYYAFLIENATCLLTINGAGTVIETIYLTTFMIYATRDSKIYTTMLLLLFNFGALGIIIFATYIFSHGKLRVNIVGFICSAFSIAVFAAPLSIMRRVIKTKSVEFMPFNLSLFLTLCAIVWFFYGLLINDYYIASPNVLGFIFGIIQMIIYAIYRNRKEKVLPEEKVEEVEIVIDLTEVEKQQVEFEVEDEVIREEQTSQGVNNV